MAPEAVHPYFLGTTDTSSKGSHEFNFTHWTLPYLSLETSKHEQLYINIQASLGDVFEWIETVVSCHAN